MKREIVDIDTQELKMRHKIVLKAILHEEIRGKRAKAARVANIKV